MMERRLASAPLPPASLQLAQSFVMRTSCISPCHERRESLHEIQPTGDNLSARAR